MNKIIFEEIKKLAEIGNAEAQYKLGKMYAKGEGTEKSWDKALCWYEKSANQDYAEAQFFLGYHVYYTGQGVPRDCEGMLKNKKKGIDLIRKAWGNGCEKARLFLEEHKLL